MTSIDNVTVISSFEAETVNVSCMYFYEYPENSSFDFITYNCQRPTFLGYVAQEFILYNHFITFTYYNTVLSYLLNNISRYIFCLTIDYILITSLYLYIAHYFHRIFVCTLFLFFQMLNANHSFHSHLALKIITKNKS